MKKTLVNTFKIANRKLVRSIALLISSLILLSYNADAQDGGPSIGNLNKNLTAAKDQMSRQEKLNYIFMALGFILVMGIAWFSTNVAKKRKLEQEELIRKRHLANTHVKHNPHDPYYKHHSGGAKVRK